MLIRNFGVHWERKCIMFGRPGVAGSLWGRRTGAPDADFREQIGVYVLSDKDLQPIYIGQAGSGHRTIFDRLKQHRNDHLWNRWEHFSWFGVKRVNKNGSLSQFDNINKKFQVTGRALLNQVEGALITALEPRLNKQGARWKDAQQYFQLVDEEQCEVTPRKLDDSIRELRQEIEGLRQQLKVGSS